MTEAQHDPGRRRVVAMGAAGMAAAWTLRATGGTPSTKAARMADLIIHNARVTTLVPAARQTEAIAVADGRVLATGTNAEVMAYRTPATTVIDACKKRLIPGLNDSHTHLIRGGLNYNMELRWEGLGSLADAMALLKAQALRTPPPQWVRVVGGFSQYQFKEKRLPTLQEINTAAPDTPVFILHLYGSALLNAAALRAVGYTRDTPDPPGGRIERDKAGNPTGLLLAKPNALILYATLAKGPRLPPEYQLNSTRHYMRELNRLGITSVIDAGGGFQAWPDDYAIIRKLHADNELTVRIAYNLFTQNNGGEYNDFQRWTEMLQPRQGDDWLRHNGAGEMLVFSAADFELFNEPRPDLPARMEPDLDSVVRLLVEKRWPFRIHATYDETISRILDVYERIDRELPFAGLHWIIDHAETISPRNIERVRALGGGIAVQHRMAFQGEAFVERYGAAAAAHTPPIRRMLDAGIPVGAGTDATRVASYNPWTALHWLVSGRTVGGMPLYGDDNLLEREEALRTWTQGSAWFSDEQAVKGTLAVGQYADLALLSADYMQVPVADIADIHSVLTVVGGRIVHADDDYAPLAPALPPAMPDWSPRNLPARARHLPPANTIASGRGHGCRAHRHGHAAHHPVPSGDAGFWGALGCSCFAF